MSADVLSSKRFWFSVVGAIVGVLVVSFAGDPSIPGWVVKLLGGVNVGCSTAAGLLQSVDAKARRVDATREFKALP